MNYLIPPDLWVRPVPLVRRLVVPDGLLRRPQLEVGLRAAEGRLLVIGGEVEGGGAVANAVRVATQLRRRRELEWFLPLLFRFILCQMAAKSNI